MTLLTVKKEILPGKEADLDLCYCQLTIWSGSWAFSVGVYKVKRAISCQIPNSAHAANSRAQKYMKSEECV